MKYIESANILKYACMFASYKRTSPLLRGDVRYRDTYTF